MLDRLRTRKRGSKMIQNIASYNILENVTLADTILFSRIEKRDQHGEVVTSDNVSKLLLRGEKHTKSSKSGDEGTEDKAGWIDNVEEFSDNLKK